MPWRSPLLKPFLPRCPPQRLTTTNRGKEGDFSTLDEVCVHRTPLAVERHGQTKRNPFFQPEVENKFPDSAPLGDRLLMLSPAELFCNLAKGDDLDGDDGILGVHATPTGRDL